MAIADQSFSFAENQRCEYDDVDYIMLPIRERAFEWCGNDSEPYAKMRYACIRCDEESDADGSFSCAFVVGRENDGEFMPEGVSDEFVVYRSQYERAATIMLRYEPHNHTLIVTTRKEHGADARVFVSDRLLEMGAENIEYA